MTYRRLFYLKYKKGISTCELFQLYPHDIGRVSEVALLDVPEKTLKQIVREESAFNRLMRLKKKFSRFF